MSTTLTWEDCNRAYLFSELARIRRALEQARAVNGTAANGTDAHDADAHDADARGAGVHATDASGGDANGTRATPAVDAPPSFESASFGRALFEPAPAIDHLADVFGLTPFERDVLLLCVGVELDRQWVARPTFALAFAALPDAHWSALDPNRPLRYWRLVDVDARDGLMTGVLRIDEAILHFLLGVPTSDVRLHAYIRPAPAFTTLPASHARHADDIVALWRQAPSASLPLPAIALSGRSRSDLCAVAAAACAALRLRLLTLDASDLPAAAVDREWLARAWARDAVLHRAALFIDGHGAQGGQGGHGVQADALASFIDRAPGFVLVAGHAATAGCRRPFVRIEVSAPPPVEREAIWRDALGPAAGTLNGAVARLAARFDLEGPEIAGTVRRALIDAAEGPALERQLWRAAHLSSRRQLETLAERIEPRASWDSLVLPRAAVDALRGVVAHVRHRDTVYDTWGFADACARGLGISALFAGASGTGKTMAAEVLARELDLDLYRIDLSQVVNKYIGETEKNLKRVFDAAECGGAMLLFDEADALFGRRSDVRDSHDRYANIEVSYLLQRMEAFQGLAILTTNRRGSLDPSFLRRVRFVVEFPFPDASQRSEIWRRVLPPRVPTAGLDFARLGRLSVAGGHIRNIAMCAAFLSAERGEPLGMAHLLRAARIECAKLDRPLNEAEVAGWC
jgi:hypothetical protein